MSAQMPSHAAPADHVPEDVTEELDLTFTPLHKRCLGMAVGTVLGVLLLAATLIHLVRLGPDEPYPLVLLGQYLPGYRVSLGGAFIGLGWGFWIGFVLGWFFAFARNLVMAATAFWFRARAELQQSGSFLDQI